MDGPDFVFFSFSLVPSAFLDAPWATTDNITDDEMKTRKLGFHALKEVSGGSNSVYMITYMYIGTVKH